MADDRSPLSTTTSRWVMAGAVGAIVAAGLAACHRLVDPGAIAPRARSSDARVVFPGAEATTRARVKDTFGKLPLAFEENRGQSPREVRFQARSGGHGLYLTATEAILSLRRAQHEPTVVHMKLLGADPDPRIAGVGEFRGKSHYLLGDDPEKWTTGVPTYGSVLYESVYRGVDLVYHGSSQSELEYDFVVAPGADPDVIRLRFEGVERLSVDGGGNLVLGVPGGEVIQRAPVVYQEVDGARRTVAGRYDVADREVGFQVATWDRKRPLVIDPVFAWSTYVGGSSFETGGGIAVDSSGSAYVIGSTGSANYPTESPFDATLGGSADVVVTKLSPDGSAVVYSTYLGGSQFDEGRAIAVDSTGSAYVTGRTDSTNFPRQNAFDTTLGGSTDAFVTKLSPSGAALVYSTYVGGSGAGVESGHAITVDSGGSAYVTGVTPSADFPLQNAFDSTRASNEAFVAKLSPSGSTLVYSTYLGGGSDDFGRGIAIDSSGHAYVAGYTFSADFPTANALDATLGGGSDAFVTKFSPDGSALVYSTYVGGGNYDIGYGIAVDPAGSAYVVGYTDSLDFPRQGAVDPTFNGLPWDGFVTKLTPAGSALAYSTYLGGNGQEELNAIAVDSAGNAWVTGYTHSTNYPAVDALDPTANGDADAVVTKIAASGSPLLYSTYLGGTGLEIGTGVALDPSGNAYIAGPTGSLNFPTTQGAFDRTANGGLDLFVMRLGGCGDAIVDRGEPCDDGAADNGTTAGCCTHLCGLVPGGTSCDDGDACTQSDQCNATGHCLAGETVVCTPSDECHVAGECDPGTGICSDPPATMGTSCSDGDPCTGPDTCDGSGGCVVGPLVLLGQRGDVDAAVECVESKLP